MTNLDYAIKLVKDRKIEITPEEIQDRRWDVHGLNNLSKQLTMWREAKGFETNKSNFASKIALTHSELSEALEADRKGDEEEKLFELADAFIRLFDLIGANGSDIEEAICFKMNLNDKRPERHGKRY